MPLFNYKCNDCNREFEELVRSGDEKVFCPDCKSENVKRNFPNKFNTANNSSASTHVHKGG
jgi:putative FmdB family regulatory protein